MVLTVTLWGKWVESRERADRLSAELKKVYETLNSRLVLERKETEITALFAAAGVVLSLFSALLSLLWFNRVL